MIKLYTKRFLIATLGLLPLCADADDFEIDGIYYSTREGTTVAVTGGDIDDSGVMIIPSEVTFNDVVYTVTIIDYGAFYCCTSLTDVTLPESLISIENSAFSGCESLTNINVPNSVTSIGQDVFNYCTSLESVTLPNDLNSIDERTFKGVYLKGYKQREIFENNEG